MRNDVVYETGKHVVETSDEERSDSRNENDGDDVSDRFARRGPHDMREFGAHVSEIVGEFMHTHFWLDSY